MDAEVRPELLDIFECCLESGDNIRANGSDEYCERMYKLCRSHLDKAVQAKWVHSYSVDERCIQFSEDAADKVVIDDDRKYHFQGNAVAAMKAVKANYPVYDYRGRKVFLTKDGELACYTSRTGYSVYAIAEPHILSSRFEIFRAESRVVILVPAGTKGWNLTNKSKNPKKSNIPSMDYRVVRRVGDVLWLVGCVDRNPSFQYCGGIVCVRLDDLIKE